MRHHTPDIYNFSPLGFCVKVFFFTQVLKGTSRPQFSVLALYLSREVLQKNGISQDKGFRQLAEPLFWGNKSF